MIYRNVLVKRHSCFRFAQPPLTFVNKQIRSESLPVLYGKGQFYSDFGTYFPTTERFVKLAMHVPAIPNLAYVTKLEIRFCFGKIGYHDDRGVGLSIYMSDDKLGCGSLGDDNLVGQPGLEWRDKAGIERHYRRLLNQEPVSRVFWGTEMWFLTRRAARSVIRILLSFAERCPAAAEWIWMVFNVRHLVARRSYP